MNISIDTETATIRRTARRSGIKSDGTGYHLRVDEVHDITESRSRVKIRSSRDDYLDLEFDDVRPAQGRDLDDDAKVLPTRNRKALTEPRNKQQPTHGGNTA